MDLFSDVSAIESSQKIEIGCILLSDSLSKRDQKVLFKEENPREKGDLVIRNLFC